MNHTVSGGDYQNLWFNGTLVGETGIHAALCGTWGCPVLLVTGDDAACAEGRELLGDGLTTVAVKRGIGAPRRVRSRRSAPGELIEEGARNALSDLSAVAPVEPGQPLRDPRRVQAHEGGRRPPVPRRRRARRRPHHFRHGPHLVGGLARVLLQSRKARIRSRGSAPREIPKKSFLNEGTRFLTANAVGISLQARRRADGYCTVERLGRSLGAGRAAAAEEGAAFPLPGPEAAA